MIESLTLGGISGDQSFTSYFCHSPFTQGLVSRKSARLVACLSPSVALVIRGNHGLGLFPHEFILMSLIGISCLSPFVFQSFLNSLNGLEVFSPFSHSIIMSHFLHSSRSCSLFRLFSLSLSLSFPSHRTPPVHLCVPYPDTLETVSVPHV